jgi:hypothetical protein
MAAAAGSTDIASLDAALTTALPDPLEVGAGTVLYLEGTCEAGADPEPLLGTAQCVHRLGSRPPATLGVGSDHRVDHVAAVAEQEHQARSREQLGDELSGMRAVRLLDQDQRVGEAVLDAGSAALSPEALQRQSP